MPPPLLALPSSMVSPEMVAVMPLSIRPVSTLSAAADEISKGNLNVPELPASGSDEIAQLARSFNRMYVSLAKAIKMLESE